MRIRILLACVGLLVATEGLAQDPAPRPAKVFTVVQQSSDVERRYPGVVLPSQEVELSFRISGNLVELPIRGAQSVTAGDVIGQLDTRDLNAQEAQLQSSVDQAQAQLDLLRAGARPQEIAALEAAIDAAEAQLVQARDQAERSQQLAERGTIASAILDNDMAALRVAEADLSARQEDLSLALAGARAEEIAAAEATLRGLEAQMQSVRDNIGYATLTAPFDGVIARREVENFVNVQAGQTIALLQALAVIHVQFDVPAPDVTELGAGGVDKIVTRVLLDALPGQIFDSEIVEFSVQADSATQTYRGRVSVQVPEDSLILPGMVGTVLTSAPGTAPSLTVPLSAVAAAPDGSPKVWVLDAENAVSERAVVLGEISGIHVEVIEGLTGGERVVSAGLSALVPGMKVTPIDKVGG